MTLLYIGFGLNVEIVTLLYIGFGLNVEIMTFNCILVLV